MPPAAPVGIDGSARRPDDEIEAYVQHVDDLVQSCNENYANEQLPQIEARDEAKQNAAQAAEDRLAEAQRRADLL